jgi:asparagine synthase (glutamine-hydrolysing)
MCGIAGWVSFERDLSGEQSALDSMTETMACRGPDARGTWLTRHAAIGHRRLAVIDLPGGRQPMTVDPPGGPVVLTYSGETYNFAPLRKELGARGHKFRTDSDTEVVLRGYLEWGDAVAERLNGMYAFAIWDARGQRLVMIRDRMGIKPFYYYETADGVLFGSEPKAILANPLARRRVDLDGLREMMMFAKAPGQTIWSGMREVVPGTVVTVDRAGLRERVYWRLSATEHTDDQATTVARVRELLDDIVRRQLVADVPRCVLLSGGLDSSTITALAARQLAPERVRTFAVDFVDQASNFTADRIRGTLDTPFAHEVAGHVGAEHEVILLDHTTLADPELRRVVVAAKDLPIGMGDLDASLYLLFKEIRERSTVALSGEAADEAFGGYPWYHWPEVQQADEFPWHAAYALVSDSDPLRFLAKDAREILDVEGCQAQAYRDAVAEVELLPGDSEQERRMRVFCYLHLTRAVRTLLDRKDRISMAVGLEVRVPFCDHRLVEYAYNVPWSLKSFDGREKSLLRAAAADLLPESVARRVKSPYPSTRDPQYVAALQQQAKEVLADRNNPAFSLLDRDWITEVSQREAAVVTMNERSGLERLLDLVTWMDIYQPALAL